jgi:hypothetical protein
MAGGVHRLRRILLTIAAVSFVTIALGACSTGAPSIDQPQVTAPAPTSTAAG